MTRLSVGLLGCRPHFRATREFCRHHHHHHHSFRAMRKICTPLFKYSWEDLHQNGRLHGDLWSTNVMVRTRNLSMTRKNPDCMSLSVKAFWSSQTSLRSLECARRHISLSSRSSLCNFPCTDPGLSVNVILVLSTYL